jgi:hypothetical protein
MEALSSVCWEKNEKKSKKMKKKREGAWGFFPRAGAGHALVAVQGGIFMVIRCN